MEPAATEGTPGAGRGRALEAMMTFWVRAATKPSTLCWSSGLRTKSTAPTARASNTFRFREDTRITGMGWVGRYCFKKSVPLCPGISTSMVITSGLYWGILTLASRVLMAKPTTSILGWTDRPLIIMLRATMESSTTMTRTFLLDGHMCAPSFWFECFLHLQAYFF